MNEDNILVSIDSTLSFLSDIKQTETFLDLINLTKQATYRYGVKNIVIGFPPKPGMLPSQQMQGILLADWPDEWSRLYFRDSLAFQDPAIRHIVRSEPSFVWSDFSKTLAISRDEKRVMDQARELYVSNGFTLPIVSLDGRCAGVTFAGGDIDDSPQARTGMALIASFSFARALELHGANHKPATRLTPREREVIGWIANGKTDWEISVIFGVSEKAVTKHVGNIRTKLGAVSRSHAVAEAFRQKLIC
ncbi:LuxR family transcriptional regulator [Agrobacterium vitis]|uniref:helix-turn-helix transcriptional regulator n=1 Tax=Agrobacterium vitis TaxID=373 RepID=UPI0018D2542F|nr:LuxR family transcriptional regulator [Agrobacterium vitis]